MIKIDLDNLNEEVVYKAFNVDGNESEALNDIYMIDYQRLKEASIKLISFDTDDTIASLEDSTASKEAGILVQKLRNMGFEVALLTNAKDTRGSHFGKVLDVDFITRAKKPRTKNFCNITRTLWAGEKPDGTCWEHHLYGSKYGMARKYKRGFLANVR